MPLGTGAGSPAPAWTGKLAAGWAAGAFAAQKPPRQGSTTTRDGPSGGSRTGFVAGSGPWGAGPAGLGPAGLGPAGLGPAGLGPLPGLRVPAVRAVDRGRHRSLEHKPALAGVDRLVLHPAGLTAAPLTGGRGRRPGRGLSPGCGSSRCGRVGIRSRSRCGRLGGCGRVRCGRLARRGAGRHSPGHTPQSPVSVSPDPTGARFASCKHSHFAVTAVFGKGFALRP
jgi:hypothetical protein